MNAQMYDPQYVAARLAARRVQVGQVQIGQVQIGQVKEKPMAKRYNLTNEEMAELRELIAGDADEEALGAFAQRYNVHGNSMRGYVMSVRRRLLAEEVAEAGPAVDEPPARAVQPAPLIIAPPTPPAPAAPPAARIETIIEWLTTIRAMRDELREHGVLVEGSVSITVDL